MDNLSIKQRTFCMSRIKSRDTNPEISVRKILTEMGLRYRLHDIRLQGKPDIIISKLKTIFFVNGCFWHRHEDCKKSTMPKTNIEYWEKKLKRNVEKQAEDIRALRNEDWKVYIIWECEIKDKNKLYEKILKIYDEHKI
jgi:DNA mismatch endonuclease (patch repair protein)